MARKPSQKVKIDEEIFEKPTFLVITKFKAHVIGRDFNHVPGDMIQLNDFEKKILQRYIKE